MIFSWKMDISLGGYSPMRLIKPIIVGGLVALALSSSVSAGEQTKLSPQMEELKKRFERIFPCKGYEVVNRDGREYLVCLGIQANITPTRPYKGQSKSKIDSPYTIWKYN